MINGILPVLLARGGGGGSGGGGGGGGGIFLLGYIPVYYVTNKVRIRYGGSVAIAVGIPTAIMVSILWFALLGPGYGVLETISAIGGLVSGYFGLHGMVARKFKKNKQLIHTAAQLDPSWDEAHLRQVVTDTFFSFQEDWSKLDYKAVATYTAPDYAYHASLMMAALAQIGRINNVAEPKIISIDFSAVSDSEGAENDSFTAYIVAQANDQLIDSRSGQLMFTDNNEFAEYWRFERSTTGWWLAGITPDTATMDLKATSIMAFAGQNNLKYSADWGWLLLPKVGDIFSTGNFGTSDINNHCIGMYHDTLVQLYSYVPGRDKKSNVPLSYTVAQVVVPGKNYGRIIIRRKDTLSFIKKIFNTAPKATMRISTESVDFNAMYELYASGYEGPTTFELLHPVYIEKMQALSFKVELEVYDNTIFLYSRDPKADYAEMFQLLQAAFEELKL